MIRNINSEEHPDKLISESENDWFHIIKQNRKEPFLEMYFILNRDWKYLTHALVKDEIKRSNLIILTMRVNYHITIHWN